MPNVLASAAPPHTSFPRGCGCVTGSRCVLCALACGRRGAVTPESAEIATSRRTMRTKTSLLLTRAIVGVTALASDATSSCRLLLVRHGETNFNFDGRLQGRLESELTENGHSQATKLGEWLAIAESASIDRVFVSPRKRTQQTLARIADEHPTLPHATSRADLREIELTVWEGQFKSVPQQSDAERWARWKAHPNGFVFEEDGHSPLGDVKRRASEEWRALVSATSVGSTSLIVAHGAFNRVFLLTALGLPVDDFGFRDVHKWFEFENCALVELLWTPGAEHASAWRRRYPAEGEWMTREQELERRARSLSSKVEL